MDIRIVKNDWQALLMMLPANWRQLAREAGAINRKLRNFDDEESILRCLFLHIANGYSGLIKRFRNPDVATRSAIPTHSL